MMSQETSDLVSGRNYHKVFVVTVDKTNLLILEKKINGGLLVPTVHGLSGFITTFLHQK